MKKPNITEGEWLRHGKFTVKSKLNEEPKMKLTVLAKTESKRMASAKAISAVPELIDEGIKAIKHLHNYWYEGAISDGQSHDAAEDFAQRKTKGLYKALEKAGVEL